MRMKRLLVAGCLMALLPGSLFAAQKVSVEELHHVVATLHGKSDRKIANRISDLELTERLSRVELQKLSGSLPGKRSRAALLGIAAASAFRDTAAGQMLSDPAPDAEAQKQILMRAAKFASEQTELIPAFEATRTTQHFQDVRVYPYSNKIEYYTPGSFRLIEQQVDGVVCTAGGDEAQDRPDRDRDRRMSRQRQPLMYLNMPFGYQVIWGNITWKIPNLTQTGMKPTGAFGPWLQAVTGDVPEAQTQWAYWERGVSGRLAVFRFRIPQEVSHYTVEYFFVPNSENPFEPQNGRQYVATPGYHGEIAIDPDTGRVARIVVVCDFAKDAPLTRAQIELEYGSAEIDGESYLLPVRGVAITTFSLAANTYLFNEGFLSGAQIDHFPVTSIDDLAFSEYRLYKPRVRILPLKSLDRPAN